MDPESLCVPSKRAIAVPTPAAFLSSHTQTIHQKEHSVAVHWLTVTISTFVFSKPVSGNSPWQDTVLLLRREDACCAVRQSRPPGHNAVEYVCVPVKIQSSMKKGILDMFLRACFRMRMVVLLNCQWENGLDHAHKTVRAFERYLDSHFHCRKGNHSYLQSQDMARHGDHSMRSGEES